MFFVWYHYHCLACFKKLKAGSIIDCFQREGKRLTAQCKQLAKTLSVQSGSAAC